MAKRRSACDCVQAAGLTFPWSSTILMAAWILTWSPSSWRGFTARRLSSSSSRTGVPVGRVTLTMSLSDMPVGMNGEVSCCDELAIDGWRKMNDCQFGWNIIYKPNVQHLLQICLIWCRFFLLVFLELELALRHQFAKCILSRTFSVFRGQYQQPQTKMPQDSIGSQLTDHSNLRCDTSAAAILVV